MENSKNIEMIACATVLVPYALTFGLVLFPRPMMAVDSFFCLFATVVVYHSKRINWQRTAMCPSSPFFVCLFKSDECSKMTIHLAVSLSISCS